MASSTEINDARREAGMHISRYYPPHKQLNILRQGSGYGPVELEQMSVFIDAVRARCDEYESADNPVIDYSDIVP